MYFGVIFAEKDSDAKRKGRVESRGITCREHLRASAVALWDLGCLLDPATKAAPWDVFF